MTNKLINITILLWLDFMKLENDFTDMISYLIEFDCRFIVVGGFALAFNGFIRNTGDIDFFVEPTIKNSEKVFNALKSFGAPIQDINPHDFTQKGTIYQIGLPPIRIDIINSIDGVSFEEAYATKKIKKIDGLKVPYLSIELLKKNKTASGRSKDLFDIEELNKL